MTGLAAGTYTLTVTDSLGCTGTAQVVISSITAIANAPNGFNFSIYPNPAGRELFVQVNNPAPGTVLNIKNVLGQAIMNQNIENQKTKLDLTALANGVYLVELVHGEMLSVKKLVINK